MSDVFEGSASDREATVLEVLQAEGVFLPAPCGGRGRCGKCAVRFLRGAPDPSAEDMACLDGKRLEAGWRLACRAHPMGEYAIELPSAESAMLVETGFSGAAEERCQGGGGRKVAVDVGTTTIAASLVNTGTGEVLATKTGVNRQRAFGADVISRIQASNEGKGELLRKSAVEAVCELIRALGEDPAVVPVIVSGNTIMEHLLQGLDCHGLGVAPYTPVDISLHRKDNFLYMPGISTYVGADIVSGICACGMDRSGVVSLLIDLGTNGEMALGGRDGLLVASTAAGPALEGGNISCGVAGVPGAICGVRIENKRVQCVTIAGDKPIGLCGTGVLETVYELLHVGIMDESGYLDGVPDGGFPLCDGITFTQRDVREVQLAKAAIRAGIETLIDAAGVSADQIETVYLAGGFGQKIDLKKAVGIGLIPPQLAGKTIAVGNSSLAGAIALAKDPDYAARLLHAVELAREIDLAGDKRFTEYYVEYMTFDSE